VFQKKYRVLGGCTAPKIICKKIFRSQHLTVLVFLFLSDYGMVGSTSSTELETRRQTILQIHRALLCPRAFNNLGGLTRGLLDLGVRTDTTSEIISALSFNCIEDELLTDVITLPGIGGCYRSAAWCIHPRIIGAIAAATPEDVTRADFCKTIGVQPIDLVIVNFIDPEVTEETTAEEAAMMIDVMRYALLVAAMNPEVAVLTKPNDYDEFLTELRKHNGSISQEYLDDLNALACDTLMILNHDLFTLTQPIHAGTHAQSAPTP